MNKILLIIRREYLTRVRKRIFLITTLLAPLSLAVIFLLPVFLASHNVEDEKIAIYDESGIFSGHIENKEHLTFGHINTVNVPYDSLKKKYETLGFNGVLRIPSSFTIDHPVNVEFFSNDQLGLVTQSNIADQMNEVLQQLADLKSAQEACCFNTLNNSQTSSTTSTNNDAPRLEQNVPNPFDQNTVIKFYLPSTVKQAQIIITDLSGQILMQYQIAQTGIGSVTINGGALASGSYYYILMIDGEKVSTKKMELTR